SSGCWRASGGPPPGGPRGPAGGRPPAPPRPKRGGDPAKTRGGALLGGGGGGGGGAPPPPPPPWFFFPAAFLCCAAFPPLPPAPPPPTGAICCGQPPPRLHCPAACRSSPRLARLAVALPRGRRAGPGRAPYSLLALAAAAGTCPALAHHAQFLPHPRPGSGEHPRPRGSIARL